LGLASVRPSIGKEVDRAAELLQRLAEPVAREGGSADNLFTYSQWVSRRIARSSPVESVENIRSSTIRRTIPMLAVPVQYFFGTRVEPYRLRISVEQTAQPGFARLIVSALDAVVVFFDFIGAHAGIPD
jgi:hypothetical protein